MQCVSLCGGWAGRVFLRIFSAARRSGVAPRTPWESCSRSANAAAAGCTRRRARAPWRRRAMSSGRRRPRGRACGRRTCGRWCRPARRLDRPELRRDHLGPILRVKPCCSPADRAPRASRSAPPALRRTHGPGRPRISCSGSRFWATQRLVHVSQMFAVQRRGSRPSSMPGLLAAPVLGPVEKFPAETS